MEHTREALLRAGEELFGAQGLDGPSLDAICARAGFTRGAFYVHFADRDAFLEAVMARAGASFLDAVLGATAGGEDLGTIAARFVNAVDAGEYPLMRAGGVRPHQLLDACVRSKAIRARYVALVRESIARLGRAVGRSQKERAVRDDVAPAQVATILLAAVVGAQTLRDLDVAVDLDGAAATLLALLSAPSPRPSTSRRRPR